MAKLRNKTLVWAIVPVGVLAILTAVFVLLGFLSIQFKQPHDEIITRSVVCGDDLIQNYNNEKSGQAGGNYEETLTAIDDQIAALASYETDPDCVYIRYDISTILRGEIETEQHYINTLNQLKERYVFVSNRIDQPSSLLSMQEQLEERKILDDIMNGNVETLE